MSSIGKSIIDTPNEDSNAPDGVADMPPEQEAQLSEAEIEEAHKQFAYWQASETLKPVLWDCNLIINGVRYNALLINDEEPDHRKVAAAIATIYTSYSIQQFLNLIVSGEATVVAHKARILSDEDIKQNYIPF